MLEEVIKVSKAGNNEQSDADILQCKMDILRARNIIPLHDGTAPTNPATQDNTGDITQSSDTAEISTHEDTSSIPIETIPAKETAPLPRPAVGINKEKVEILEETPEIPHFDLAEEIMAEQRKITAIRRKAPGKKTEAQRSEPQVQPTPELPEQEKIIAEIVTRDIERLCRG
jgi:hypothetical protein